MGEYRTEYDNSAKSKKYSTFNFQFTFDEAFSHSAVQMMPYVAGHSAFSTQVYRLTALSAMCTNFCDVTSGLSVKLASNDTNDDNCNRLT